MEEDNIEGIQEFKKLLNYRDTTKYLRFLSLAILIGSLLFALTVFIIYTGKASENSSKIYVMDKSGNIAKAELSNYTQEHKVWESKAHIIDAIKYMFELGEGEDNFEKRLEKGLFYFGNSGKQLVDEYTRVKFKQDLQSKNAETKVIIEPRDIKLEINEKGQYYGTVTFIQVFKAVGVTNKNARKLTYEFFLEDYQRSDNNLHGIKIEPFRIINQEKVEL
jgi:hypothetical protein